MLHLIDRLGSFLKLRALRYGVSLEEAGVDAQTVVARIGRSELFCNSEEETIHALLESMAVTQVRAGTNIVSQGDRSDCFLVLACGSALVTHAQEGEETRILATLSEPTGLGEDALWGGAARAFSVTMQTDGTVLRIRRDAFAAFVGARAVKWVECAKAAGGGNVRWLWFGPDDSRAPRTGTLGLLLSQLRERISDLDRGLKYYCCCRDGKESAIAAFVLGQRGFDAYAVRDGRTAIARDAA